MRRAVSVTALPLVGGGLTAGCTGDQGRGPESGPGPGTRAGDRVSPPGGGTR